jgi:hypothetical protein
MPTFPPVLTAPNKLVSDEKLHFDYPGSDIILSSRDSHDFRVPQLYLVNSSPVLRELIRGVLNTSDVAGRDEQEPLPVVKLPESGAILYSLLTFIFPVTPVPPSTTENIMKLLAVAQRYQMDAVLTHVRTISRQVPAFILPETALYIYFLAQKYELHQEVIQAARRTLRLSMTIEALDDKLRFIPGAYLRELWKYHQRVRADLKLRLPEFRRSSPDGVKDLRCGTPDLIPQWLGDYIESLADAPHLLDLIEFENVRARHIKEASQRPTLPACSCAGISNEAIRAFWDALTAVVHGTIEQVCRAGVTRPHLDDEYEPPQADSTLALVKEEPNSENSDPPFVPLGLNVPDADIILRSSDQVNFRVHKSLLTMSSPFFEDLLSLPQPPDGELADGLPLIQLSEDAGLLNSLISVLYPIPPVIPGSYEEVFALLAACQKYDMTSIQSHIRAEIKLGTFPVPFGTEAFRGYAVASSMGLIPEMESAARLTLSYPMTFESLGEVLKSFSGRALCDLVCYRKCCRNNLVSCLDSFFNARSRCQIWVGCQQGSSWGTHARGISTDLAAEAGQYTTPVAVPAEYQQHAQVFSEEELRQFPPVRSWDHAINFKPGSPESLNCKVYATMPVTFPSHVTSASAIEKGKWLEWRDAPERTDSSGSNGPVEPDLDLDEEESFIVGRLVSADVIEHETDHAPDYGDYGVISGRLALS